MLKTLHNRDTAFRQSRYLIFAFLLFSFGIVVYVVYTSYQSSKAARETIFILDQGSILAAKAQNIHENRPVEAREHVKRFHQYFFTLSPDQSAITNTVEKALMLADRSVKMEYDNLKENGFYNQIISGNISQNIRIDTVHLDTSVDPFYFRAVGVMEIIRTSSITFRNIEATGYLRNVLRSDNNPHGFLLEGWRVTKNQDIKTIAR